ncbi:glycoside hydrolase family 105 protein [Xylariaceae sp. FL0255]|nr:glycoside hydrolase family 105 protein [Xylariaceae sp. FL0255]
MPSEVHGLKSREIHAKIQLLINGMVNIRDKSGQFLMTLSDGRIIDTKGWDDWEWTHGIGLLGIWAYYKLTTKPQYLEIIEDWFSARFASGGTTKNINTMAAIWTLVRVYDETKNGAYLPHIDSWAEWAYHDLKRTKHGGMQHVTYLDDHDQQLWDDTLIMTVLPLAEIGRLLGRKHYIVEAKKQFLLHVQYLFDARTGLFFHGWNFEEGQGKGALRQGHNFANARWARGNAWLTMAIPDFLELLELEPSQDDPALAAFLTSTLNAQVAALKTLQDPASGLWHTLLDHSDSYVEASATAGFAFGLLKARRKRYIGPKYGDVALSALRAVLDNIDEAGELKNTSFGTAVGNDLQHYRDIPVTSMPYGQAMAIMALVEFLRMFI